MTKEICLTFSHFFCKVDEKILAIEQFLLVEINKSIKLFSFLQMQKKKNLMTASLSKSIILQLPRSEEMAQLSIFLKSILQWKRLNVLLKNCNIYSIWRNYTAITLKLWLLCLSWKWPMQSRRVHIRYGKRCPRIRKIRPFHRHLRLPGTFHVPETLSEGWWRNSEWSWKSKDAWKSLGQFLLAVFHLLILKVTINHIILLFLIPYRWYSDI